jgi:hypothetical protein
MGRMIGTVDARLHGTNVRRHVAFDGQRETRYRFG